MLDYKGEIHKDKTTIAATIAVLEEPDICFVSEVTNKTLDPVLLADELTAR